MTEKGKLWKELISKIIKDFRLSEQDFAKLTGLSQPTINRLRAGDTDDPYPSTIKKIENGLGVRIDESDPNQLNYERIREVDLTIDATDLARDTKKFTVSYPILGQIPAGLAEVKETNDWPEYSDLYYDPRKHFWLQIDDEYGFSMNPFLKSGDLILCAVPPFKLKDGDLVAVRWDKTKGALKLYKEKGIGNDKLIILTSYNASESPIVLRQDEIEQIYKVVNIKKK